MAILKGQCIERMAVSSPAGGVPAKTSRIQAIWKEVERAGLQE